MSMKLALLASILGMTILGCGDSIPSSKSGQVGEDKPAEKTVDDARKYMQEQIDRYLGGQRTQEQLMKITHNLKPTTNIINHGPIESILITNVLPWYSEEGEREKDGFVIMLTFAGADWHEKITVHLAPTAHGDGEWFAI